MLGAEARHAPVLVPDHLDVFAAGGARHIDARDVDRGDLAALVECQLAPDPVDAGHRDATSRGVVLEPLGTSGGARPRHQTSARAVLAGRTSSRRVGHCHDSAVVIDVGDPRPSVGPGDGRHLAVRVVCPGDRRAVGRDRAGGATEHVELTSHDTSVGVGELDQAALDVVALVQRAAGGVAGGDEPADLVELVAVRRAIGCDHRGDVTERVVLVGGGRAEGVGDRLHRPVGAERRRPGQPARLDPAVDATGRCVRVLPHGIAPLAAHDPTAVVVERGGDAGGIDEPHEQAGGIELELGRGAVGVGHAATAARHGPTRSCARRRRRR